MIATTPVVSHSPGGARGSFRPALQSRSRPCLAALAQLAVAVALSACGTSAAEQKSKFDAIQKKADERIAQIEKQGKDQLAEAQKKIDELTKDMSEAGDKAKAEAKAEAEEEVSKAHAEADKLAAEAAKALAKARAAYKEDERHQFAELSKDVDALRIKAAKAPAKTKAQIDKAVKDLVAKRDAAAKEIPEIDKATLETLRAAKAKVDQKMALLKQAVHALQAKLP
jgi:hypothetical protein